MEHVIELQHIRLGMYNQELRELDRYFKLKAERTRKREDAGDK